MPGIHITEKYIRLRQKEPSLFEKGSLRTITLSKGVKAIVGKMKGKKTTTIQSLLFDKKVFSTKTAKAWVKTHANKFSEQKIIKVKAKMDLVKMLNQISDVHFAENGRWPKKSINDLPDSSFAIILPGGKKDKDGKTVPRNLRKLPYKDMKGKVDLPHLRNALARVNQPKTGLTPIQRSKAKLLLGKLANQYLKSHKEKQKSQKMSEDVFEDVPEVVEFQVDDIYSKVQSIAERLEASETLDDAKNLVDELKSLIPIEEGDVNEQEEQEQEEGRKEKQEESEKEEEKEKIINVKEDKIEEDTKLSEAIKLNDKILTALKESENENDKSKELLKKQSTKFEEQVNVLNKINQKYKSDFNSLIDEMGRFLSVLELKRVTAFKKKVDKVSNDYCSFMGTNDEKEKAKVRDTMSKWSDDMIEQTAKAISMKRTKMSGKEPVVLTTPSSKLKQATTFSEKDWNNMSSEDRTNFLHKKFIDLN